MFYFKRNLFISNPKQTPRNSSNNSNLAGQNDSGRRGLDVSYSNNVIGYSKEIEILEI